jgi:hypothetical protein
LTIFLLLPMEKVSKSASTYSGQLHGDMVSFRCHLDQFKGYTQVAGRELFLGPTVRRN